MIFFATGLRLRLVFMPLLLLLFLLNIGYSIGAVPLMDQPEIANWIATSWYMAVTVMFFAMVISEDTAARLDMLRRGLVVGAMIASLAAIAGYFNLVPGGHDLLTLYERARGTFKDPNVLGAFLILPALFVLQSVVSDRFGKSFRSAIAFGIMSLAILLAFSRAAWGGLDPDLGLHAGADGPDQPVARRSARASSSWRWSRSLLAAAAARGAAVVRFDRARCSSSARASTRAMTRAASAGSAGTSSAPRWRSTCRSASARCSSTATFPEDTHNSYLNAFMSGGWLSGICYPALVFVTVIMGFRHVFVRVPWQRAYLAIFAAFLGTVGESFIIDTDHWRHFWMMLGAMWGMYRRRAALQGRPPVTRSTASAAAS